MRRYSLLIAMLFWPAAFLWAADLPPGATLLDNNFECEKWKEPTIAVSPDGKSIAYVNSGAIWVCQVDNGPGNKLADLKGSIEEFSRKRSSAMREAWSGKYARCWAMARSIKSSRIRAMLMACNGGEVTKQSSMCWQIMLKAASMPARYQIMEASTTSEVRSIVNIDRGVGEEPHALTAFHVRADNKFVVATGPLPLIWDVGANQPVATPFDYLLPSSTSDRYLGIEIDTRQLVLVDENFKITKRFEVTFDQNRQCDLIWSPDERFAICRSFRSSLEPMSNKCSVFRIDLKSGQRRSLPMGLKDDRYFFSGHGGEVVQLGTLGDVSETYGNGSYGSYIEFYSDGKTEEREINRFTNPGEDGMNSWHRAFYPPALCSPNCSLFAVALPRLPNQPHGYHFHLIDRNGNKWRFAGGDSSDFISPYVPIAFVEGGEKLVAHDESRLFTIPVSAIKAATEAKK